MTTNRIARTVLVILACLAAAAGAVSAGHAAVAAQAQPTAPSDAKPIDLNKATAQELCTLPGIGPAKAEAIVAYRAKHGAFTRPEDLLAVPGIGERLLENIGRRITVKPN